MFGRFQSRENWDIVISIRHGIELCLLKMRSEFDCGIRIDVNQQELTHKMVMEVGKVGESRFDFCKVTDSYWPRGSQSI